MRVEVQSAVGTATLFGEPGLETVSVEDVAAGQSQDELVAGEGQQTDRARLGRLAHLHDGEQLEVLLVERTDDYLVCLLLWSLLFFVAGVVLGVESAVELHLVSRAYVLLVGVFFHDSLELVAPVYEAQVVPARGVEGDRSLVLPSATTTGCI